MHRNRYFSALLWRLLLLSFFGAPFVLAGDEIKLEVTVIKGNTELPKFLYIVPWQSGEGAKIDEQKLVLHGLFMGVLDPVLPAAKGTINNPVVSRVVEE